MIQELDKIFASLRENERSALIVTIVYSLVCYTMLIVSFDEFKFLEWYQGIIISIGLAITVISLGYIFYPPVKDRYNQFYSSLFFSILTSGVFTFYQYYFKSGIIAFAGFFIFSIILMWIDRWFISPITNKKKENTKEQKK